MAHVDTSRSTGGTKAFIDQLNEAAKALCGNQSGPAARDALFAVARQFNLLEEVAEDGPCTMFRTTAGALLNCWTLAEGSMTDRIEEGGLGFDDIIDWYLDRQQS